MLGLEYCENANYLLENTRGKGRFGELQLAATPSRVIHKENKLRLLFYEKNPSVPAPEGKTRTPILIVPSLINRHYILDLLPDKSLIAFLVSRGYDVAAIDWGAPGDEDKEVPFERYVDTYIHRSIKALGKETGVKKPVLLGYCLGGTMATIHAAVRPDTVAGLIALTAPINFHNSGLLSIWCQTPNFDIATMVKAFGNVPWPLMQMSFQMLRPTMNAARTLAMLKRWNDKEYIDSALALELWLDDNVSFPGECYRNMITQLYRDNALINGSLKLYDEAVDFTLIKCPVLNVAASEDHIVPIEATRALETLVRSEDYSELLAPGGHIGAVISRKASTVLWPHMAHWLDSRFTIDADQKPAATREVAAQPDLESVSATVEVEPAVPVPVAVAEAEKPAKKRVRVSISSGASKRRQTEAAPVVPVQAQAVPIASSEPEVANMEQPVLRARIRPWQAPLA